MSKRCTVCHAELPDAAAFCPHCTTSLVEKQNRKQPFLWKRLLFVPVLVVIFTAVTVGVWVLLRLAVVPASSGGSEWAGASASETAPLPEITLRHGSELLFDGDVLHGAAAPETLEVLYGGQPVADFTVEGYNDDIVTAAVVDGKLVLTPTATGMAQFAIRYDGAQAVFRGYFELPLSELRLVLPDGTVSTALHLHEQGGETVVWVDLGGTVTAPTFCKSDDQGVVTVEIVERELRITPVAEGKATITVACGDASGTFPVEVVPHRIGIRIGNNTFYGIAGGTRAVNLGIVHTDDTMVVVCNDKPISDFTVEGHNDDVFRFKVENGQLVRTPIQIGDAAFSITHDQETVTFSGWFEDLSSLGVRYGDDCEAGEGHIGSVFSEERFVVAFNGTVIEDFTVVSYNADVATVANEDGRLVVTAVSEGRSEFMLSYPYGNGDTEYNTYTVDVYLVDKANSCGENLTWTLSNAGVLTISGTGEMADFTANFDTKQCDAPWYDYRAHIRSVVLEDGVTRIGDGAFYNCTELTQVAIPDSVTEIGWGTFASCKRLPSVRIPEGVTEIDSCAFAFCNELVAVVVPGSVRQLRQRVFYDCWMLIDVELGEGITSIGSEAFRGCFEMTEIVIPASVITISADAFPEGVRLLEPQGE